jgi:hypothetical protein
MNYTYFTVIISVAVFPSAEVCVTLLQKFYPKIKVIMAFDYSGQYSQERCRFFKERNVNILKNICSDQWSSMSHGKQLDRLASIVQTPYFITMDDDAFMKKKGIIERCIGILEENRKIKLIGPLDCQRFHPFFSIVDTMFYRKSQVSFRPLVLGDTWYDTASALFLECQNKRLFTRMINDFVHDYVDHMSSMTGRLGNFMEHCGSDFFFSKIHTDFPLYNQYLLQAGKAVRSNFVKLDDVVEKDFGFARL